jgi:hypothetical protein
VETVRVEARRAAPVVRGVFVTRSSAGGSATALGAGDVFLVADREPGGQSGGGGFGPPPPPVPFRPPGEGGGGPVVPRVGPTNNPGPPDPPGPDDPIQRAACDARDALGAAGAPLDRACRPGSRGVVRETLGVTADVVESAAGEAGLELELAR